MKLRQFIWKINSEGASDRVHNQEKTILVSILVLVLTLVLALVFVLVLEMSPFEGSAAGSCNQKSN